MRAFLLPGIALLILSVCFLPLRLETAWKEKEGFFLAVGFPFLPERPAKNHKKTLPQKLPPWPVLKILGKNGYTTLCHLAERVKVEILTVRFTAAFSDPAATAAAYAAAGLAMETLLELGGERLASAELCADVDFDGDRPRLFFHLRISLRVYRLLAAAVIFALGFARDYIRYKKGKEK